MMQTSRIPAFAIAVASLAPHLALADSSYQKTEQIGGAIADQVRSLGVLGHSISRQFEPTTTLTMVQSNRKAVVNKSSMEISDLDAETITRVDMDKKTYSVVTFAQMRDALKKLPAQMQQGEDRLRAAGVTQNAGNPQVSVDVSVKNTGVSKMVNGLMAQEQIITTRTTMANPNVSSANPVATLVYVTTVDIWIAPDPPEVKDIQAFDQRLAIKMFEGVDVKGLFASMQDAGRNAGFAQMFGNQPGAADAYKKVEQEKAKLKGTHVLEVTTMTMSGVGPDGNPIAMAAAGAPGGAAPAGSAPTTGSVTKDAATDAATQSAGVETGKLGTFGSILGNSALGAFRKKKAAAPAPAPAAPTATPATATGAAGPASPVFMSNTTSMTNFSQDPVPQSAFLIPAGFKKVQSPYELLPK